MADIFDKLIDSNPDLALTMLETEPGSILNKIKTIITDAGINEGIYTMMRKDVLHGNFNVIYLDQRLVGNDAQRKKAAEELDKIRQLCVTQKNQGRSTGQLLFRAI